MRNSTLLKMTILVCIHLVTWNMTFAYSSSYPSTKINPYTGSAYDLGGKTFYIYDYWTQTNWSNNTPVTESEIATYNYRKRIESTYNCHIVQIAKGNWETCAAELINFARNPDGNLCLFVVEPGKIGSVLSSGLIANWKESTMIDITNLNWPQNALELTTYKEHVYGVPIGQSGGSICLYFNKRVLEEAGVDWNTIYNMQQNRSWSWPQFESLLETVQRDTDGDGYVDILGLTGALDDLCLGAVFSNGGSFLGYNSNGDLAVTAGTERSKAALQWAKRIWNTYARKQRNYESWDYYKSVWKSGYVAFYICRTSNGFSTTSEMTDMKDPWGCVVFPKGNEVSEYVNVLQYNTVFIPNVYTNEELSEITFIYDLWTTPTPDADLDLLSKYTDLTDQRAVYETYAMLTDAQTSISDKTFLIGNTNDILGTNLLWGLQDAELDDLIEEAYPQWTALVDLFTEKMDTIISSSIPAKTNETLYLPANLITISDHAFESISAKYVYIPSSCLAIGSRAFANNPQLLIVYIPESIRYIADDAFEGSNPEIVWK